MASKVKGDFSKGSVPKIIMKLSVPIFLAELVHIAYNIVDRAFIGRIPEVGTAALTGVGVAFPLITLITAFGNFGSMGGAPLASIARGEGDNKKAQRIQETSLTFLLAVGAVLTVILYLFAPQILALMGGNEATLPFAIEYFKIYVIGTIPVLISLGMNNFINSQGFPMIGMMTVLIGAALNIILDPILIFTVGMGVKGAAVATVISQLISAVWALWFLCGKKPVVPIRRLQLCVEDLKNILKLGVTGFTFKGTNSIVQALVNITLKTWSGTQALSTLYIGVMTVINSIREIIMCPVNGVASGTTPVMSFNYGAKKPDRVSRAISFLLKAGVGICIVFWLIMLFAPHIMFSIFTPDPDLISLGRTCGRVYFLVFPMMALQLTGQNTFVALNMPKYSLFFSMLRKIILVAPLTVILPYTGLGAMGVFWAESVSQLIGATATFTTMCFKVWRPLRRQAKEQAFIGDDAG